MIALKALCSLLQSEEVARRASNLGLINSLLPHVDSLEKDNKAKEFIEAIVKAIERAKAKPIAEIDALPDESPAESKGLGVEEATEDDEPAADH